MKCIRLVIILSSLLFMFSSCSKTELMDLEPNIQQRVIQDDIQHAEPIGTVNPIHLGNLQMFEDRYEGKQVNEQILGSGNTETGEICTVDISYKEQNEPDGENEGDRP